MTDLKVFSTRKEIFEILGWKYEGNYQLDEPLIDRLLNNGFNFDDIDIGFACREPLQHIETDDEENGGSSWHEWNKDVYWLGMKMTDSYKYRHIYFGGYHWYTVHHS